MAAKFLISFFIILRPNFLVNRIKNKIPDNKVFVKLPSLTACDVTMTKLICPAIPTGVIEEFMQKIIYLSHLPHSFAP